MASINMFPPLPESPVSQSFDDLIWNPVVADRCGLTDAEKAAVRVADPDVRVVLKMLDIVSSSPSSHVSKLSEPVAEKDAIQILYTDNVGVITHFSIFKLYEAIVKTSSLQSIYVAFEQIDLQPLVRILHFDGPDEFAQTGSSLCLGIILLSKCPSMHNDKDKMGVEAPVEMLQKLLSWIALQLVSSNLNVLPCLKLVMNAREARFVFADCGGIGCLGQCLATCERAPAQSIYEMCFCLWTMSLDFVENKSTATRFQRDCILPILAKVLKAAPREKVVRITVSCLCNVVSLKQDMVECGLAPIVANLHERHQWTDIDMVQDLEILHNALQGCYHETNDWDLYKGEIKSGNLEWGITHTSTFIQQHVRQFEENDFYLVKKLLEWIEGSGEDIVSIACFDLGEFVRHYPNGRTLAKRWGAHNLVMKHLDCPNPEVSRHALQAMSKLLIKNWDRVKC